MNKYPERECPECDSEMKREECNEDGWNYQTDTHTTTESYVWVCTNPECKHEFEDDGDEPFNVDGDE